MTLRYLILGGSALLVGFLFFPRGEVVSVVNQELIKPVRTLDNEPLHYTDILRTDPIFITYDLGFVYKIHKAEILFEDADESGPRQYDILVHTDRIRQQFTRAFSFSGSSREYTYTLQAFPLPVEARWIQVVINDWFSNKPQLKEDEFRVGLRYQSHGPIRAIDSNYNAAELHKLTDLLPFEGSKWTAAQRIAKEVKEENGQKNQEISYITPKSDIEVSGDLGGVQRIYGVRLTTDGPGNNLKRYHFSVSTNGQNYTEVYVSNTLPDDTVTHFHQFDPPKAGRYVRLRIEPGDWYGDYPEIREFEVFTDGYRLPPHAEHRLSDYNAVQMAYENLGEAGNAFTPHLTQGFAFDRDRGDRNRYSLPVGDEADKVDADNTPGQRSFAYHYDTVEIKYTGLNPSLLYWVQVTYLQERAGERIQNFDVDGFLLHDAMQLPRGKAESHTYAIPEEAYADDEIALHFNRLAGPNAAVSEVFILQADPTGAADLASIQLLASNNRTVGRAVRMTQRVVVDGKVDEWPLLYPMLPQGYENPVDSPVALYTQWDDDNLYIAAIVNPEAHDSRNRRKSNNNEVLHLFVDATLNRSPGMYTTSDHHFVFTILNPQRSQPRAHPSQTHHHLDAIPKNIDYHDAIEIQVARAGRGYLLEARIPKALVLKEFQPVIGQSIGLNYVMTDLKLANNRSGWFAYASDDLNAPPVQWNAVELHDQISGRIALMDERATQRITSFNAGDTLTLCVWDAERNTDRHWPESIEAELRNDISGQSITVVLYESDLAALADDNPDDDLATNSALFAAKVPTAYGGEAGRTLSDSSAPDSTILFVRGEDTVSLTYIDPYYSSMQREHPVSTSVTVNTGATGVLAITTESGERIEQFRLGDTIYIQVEDGDLLQGHTQPEAHGGADAIEGEQNPCIPEHGIRDSEVTVAVIVPETEEIETVELSYQPERGGYAGAIATAYSESPTPDDGILQAVGAQTVEAIYEDGIQATGETSAWISALARVEIGATAWIEFSPTVDLRIADDLKFFKAGNPLTVLLHDTDLNTDDARQETVDVILNGDQLQDQYQLTLKETDEASGEFTGTCTTQYATGADAANSALEVTGKELVTVRYIDALQGSGETYAAVMDKARVSSGKDGTLEILKANYVTNLEDFNAGDRLYFRLHDADIINEYIQMTITGETLNDQETVRLLQSTVGSNLQIYPVAGTFFGSIQTAYSTQRQEGDGVLQVQGPEQVRAIYIDELRSTGETNVEVADVCVANVGITGAIKVYNKEDFDHALDDNPEISRFRAGDTLILEIWDADLNAANAVAQLSETDFTESTVRDNIRVTLVEVTGSAGTFRGSLQTRYGETPIPNDNILQVQGEGIVTFTYIDALQNTGATQVPIQVQLAVETGDQGKLEIFSAESGKMISGFAVGTGSFNVGEKLRIRLEDKDLNTASTATDIAEITASGNVIADEVRMILRETSPNSAIFEGDLQTQKGELPAAGHPPPVATDDLLQITDKEVITVAYTDDITTTGETGVSTQIQAVVLGSSAGLLRIVDETAIETGLTPDHDLVSSHELGNFNAGETIYFWLEDLLLSTVVEADEVTIAVVSDTTNDRVEVTLSKKLGAEGIFVASLPTRYGTTPVADETLDVQGGEEIRAIYTPNFPNVNNPVVEDSAYTNKGSRGYIVITRKDGATIRHFNIGMPLYFRLQDADLNLDPFVVESTNIKVITATEEVEVTLHEESPNSQIFRGEISTQYGRSPSAGAEPVLGLVGGEIVTAIYEDALIDTGETNVEISSNCRTNLIARVPYTRNSVLIDGLEDSWPLEQVLKTAQDEGLVWLQWDKDYLYLLAQIYDDHVVVPDVMEYYRGADALELHIDLQPDAVKKPSYLQTESNPNRYIIWICPKGGGFHGDQPYVGQGAPEFIPNYQATNLSVAVRQRSDYYVIEARIPFFPVLRGFDPLKTRRHNRIGFNFVIHRSDDQAVYWAEPMPEAGPVFPSDLGLLILELPMP
ncbi:MAG: discoidin domain-containing protein [Candidatus Poribacteria bacterium]|nr:discoidin domain-containing protein [Candidatus Poribacteria bacterium]